MYTCIHVLYIYISLNKSIHTYISISNYIHIAYRALSGGLNFRRKPQPFAAHRVHEIIESIAAAAACKAQIIHSYRCPAATK